MENLDVRVFHYINAQLSFPFADQVMLACSSPLFWVLVLGTALFLAKRTTSTYHLFGFLLLVLLAVGLSDFLSSQVFKELFTRLRPCHALEGVRLIAGCGSEFGFPSGHATNSMTGILLFILVFRKMRWAYWTFLIPLVVAFSRIYLGVHYPTDVLAGLVLGSIVAATIYFILGFFPKWTKWRDAEYLLQ